MIILLTNSPKHLNHVGNQQTACGNFESMTRKDANVGTGETFKLSHFASDVKVLDTCHKPPRATEPSGGPFVALVGNGGQAWPSELRPTPLYHGADLVLRPLLLRRKNSFHSAASTNTTDLQENSTKERTA